MGSDEGIVVLDPPLGIQRGDLSEGSWGHVVGASDLCGRKVHRVEILSEEPLGGGGVIARAGLTRARFFPLPFFEAQILLLDPHDFFEKGDHLLGKTEVVLARMGDLVSAPAIVLLDSDLDPPLNLRIIPFREPFGHQDSRCLNDDLPEELPVAAFELHPGDKERRLQLVIFLGGHPG